MHQQDMTWRKWLLLLVLLVVGLFAGAVYLVFFHETGHRIVGQYVDYDCRPVANANWEFRASMQSPWPYGGGAQRRHSGQTDTDGRFEIAFKTKWLLNRFDIEINQAGDPRRGLRRFDLLESGASLSSTRDQPIYIYRQSPEFIRHRFNNKMSYNIQQRAGGGNTRHSVVEEIHDGTDRIGSRKNRGLFDAHMRWKPDKEGWALTLTALKGGGFIEYPVKDLPFDAKIPEQGYQESMSFRLPTKENPTVRKAYYYRHQAGLAYGTFFIHADYENIGYGTEAQMNLVHDLLLNEDGVTTAPVLPPFACGGTAARGTDEKFVTSKSLRGRNILPTATPSAPIANTAADPDTSLDWIQQHLDDPVVLSNALASYGKVPERYPLIYEGSRTWLRLQLDDKDRRKRINWRNNSVIRLAQDERTPTDILERILIDFPFEPVAAALSENPNLPADTVKRIATGLLNHDYESVAKRSGASSVTGRLLRDLAKGEITITIHEKPIDRPVITALLANPRLGLDHYRVLSVRLFEQVDTDDQGLQNHMVKLLLENPGLPEEVLTHWTDRLLEKNMTAQVEAVLSHPNTRREDLERLGKHFFRAENEQTFWNLGKFLENPNLSHDLLYWYVTELPPANHRDIAGAVLHPAFDRSVLVELLNPNNVKLAETLLKYNKLERLNGRGPSIRHYTTPTDVIALIADHEALSKNRDVQSAIARHPNTSPRLLQAMIEQQQDRLDRQLIQNPGLTEAQFKILRERRTPRFADKSLARNTGTPEDILMEIADNPDRIRNLLDNPVTSASVLDKIYRTHFLPAESRLQHRSIERLLRHPNIAFELMDQILLDEAEPGLFVLVLRTPATDARVIEKIYTRGYVSFSDENSPVGSRQVSELLAAHPATPWKIKRKLRRY